MSGLAGKKAVVVGGGTGIGQAIARGLADAGTEVAIGGRRESVLKETATGTSMLTHTIDVACRDSTNAFFKWATEQLGHIDIFVNAAGVNIKCT